MTKAITLGTAVALIALLLACGKKQSKNDELPKPEPTPLFKPAMSYWSLDKTKQTLGYSNFEVLEDRRPLVSDRRPPFRTVSILVPNYKDHDYTGDLVLSFYNDRLWKTQYYVANLKEYVPHAENDQGMMIGREGSTNIAPHTRVWTGKDGDGKTYLGMQDEVLKGQMDDWIIKYSNQ
jgi:hypothetical protein